MPHSTPPDTALSGLKANVHRGFAILIDAFAMAGFTRNNARLWAGAWRLRDQPAALAQFAMAARRLGSRIGQAIPWSSQNIPAHVAVQCLPCQWRAGEASRVAAALRQRDPALTRKKSLHKALAWARSHRNSDECLAFITRGYTVRAADAVELSIAFAHLDHERGKPGGPSSTIAEWLASGIPATWAVRFTIAGIRTVDEALALDQQRLADPDGFRQAFDVLQALGGDTL